MSNISQRDISNNILRNNLNLVINELFQGLLGYNTDNIDVPSNQNQNRYNARPLSSFQMYSYTSENPNTYVRTMSRQSTINETNNIFNIFNTINQSSQNNYINAYSYSHRNRDNNNTNNAMNRSSVGRNRFNISNIINHNNHNNYVNENNESSENNSEQNNNYEYNHATNINDNDDNYNNEYNFFTRNSILNSNMIDNRDIISLRTIFRIIDVDSENNNDNDNDVSYNVFEITYNTRDVSNSVLTQTLSSLFNAISGTGSERSINNYMYYNSTNYNRNIPLYSDLSEILARSLYDKPIYKRKISEKGKEKLINTKYNSANHYNMNTSCPIMQTDFEEGEEIIVLPCNHCFNPEAIHKWLNEKSECPVCRYELESEEVRIDNDNDNDEIERSNDNANDQDPYPIPNMRNRTTTYPYYNFMNDLLNIPRENLNSTYNYNYNQHITEDENEQIDLNLDTNEELEMEILLNYLFDNSLNRI